MFILLFRYRKFILALGVTLFAPGVACSQNLEAVGGGVMVLLDSAVTLNKERLWLPFSHEVQTTAAFNGLCIGVPNGYTQNLRRMSMDAPSGDSVSISVSVSLADNTVIPMEFAGFSRWRSQTGELGHGYCLNLPRAHHRLPIGTRLKGLTLSSNHAIVIKQILWTSIN